jgi:hypothetical protein
LRRAQSITTGVIMATIVVLLRKAESPAIGGSMRSSPTRSSRLRPNTRLKATSRAPVWRSAADSTRSAPTVSMDSFAKPAKVSAGVSTPQTASATSPPIRMMSAPAISAASAAITATTMTAVAQASKLMAPQHTGEWRVRRGLPAPGSRVPARLYSPWESPSFAPP